MAVDATTISLMEPAFRVGGLLEGYVHGLPEEGATIRFTCKEACKRTVLFDGQHLGQGDQVFRLFPIHVARTYVEEQRPLEPNVQQLSYFAFHIPPDLPPSFKAHQHGVLLSCAYRIVILDKSGKELAETFAHVVGNGALDEATTTHDMCRELSATRNIWILPPRLRFGKVIFKLPVIFTAHCPTAHDTYAGSQLLVDMSAYSDVAPTYLKLSIWRTVEIWDQNTGERIFCTSMNVQRFKAKRPFVGSFEGTYYINVPRRACSYKTPIMKVSYFLKVILSLGFRRKLRHIIPLHINHLFAKTIMVDSSGDAAKGSNWEGVYGTMAQRGLPTHCPICFDPFLGPPSCCGACSTSGGLSAPLHSPRASSAGAVERISSLISRGSTRPPAEVVGEEASGDVDAATVAMLSESHLLREASIPPARSACGASGGVLVSRPGAATAPLHLEAHRRATTSGAVRPSDGSEKAAAQGDTCCATGSEVADDAACSSAEGCDAGACQGPCERLSRSAPGDFGVVAAKACTSPWPWTGTVTEALQGEAAMLHDVSLRGSAGGMVPASQADTMPSDEFLPEIRQCPSTNPITERVVTPDSACGGQATGCSGRLSATGLMASTVLPTRGKDGCTSCQGQVAAWSTVGAPGLLVTDCCHVFHASCLLMFEKFHTLNTFTRPSCPVCRSVYRKQVVRAAGCEALPGASPAPGLA